MNDDMMRCPTCGTERVSRYAAYCHVCGSPLPELPETAGEQAGAAPPPPANLPGNAAPPAAYGQQPAYTATPVPPPAGAAASRPPAEQMPPPPAASSGVRVYDRPEVPPSAQRRKRLMLIIAAIGVLLSLLLLLIGPLRNVLGARSGPDWTPPGTATPVGGVITGTLTSSLPPGMSAAQATAQARRGTATLAPTWTPDVDLGSAATAAPGALPTLAPAATTTRRPTATSAPTEAPPTAAPPTQAPAATTAPTASPAPPTATVEPTAQTGAGASLPAAISGGRAIAFVSDRTGSPQVWVMDASGGNQMQVTREGTNTSPSWSPDDRFLYYIGMRNGDKSVYRLDVTTGSEERLLADPGLVAARPLANGQLAFVRMENGNYTLYVGQRRLFQLDRSFQFQLSPDGSKVVIDPNEAPRVITVVDVASTQAAEVAPANSWNAGWGAGNRLTYVSDRTGIASVYISGPNGEEARAVSPADKWSQAPAFSSDGSQIAFIGGDGPAWNVYAVPATGGQARKVGGPANPGKSPAWQPAGALLAFESDRSGNWDIYATDPNGNERNLTNAPGNDVDPAWTW